VTDEPLVRVVARPSLQRIPDRDGIGATSDRQLFVARLTAWFRRSRFVGYGFGPNNFQTRFHGGHRTTN
jgi:hypothetical protein